MLVLNECNKYLWSWCGKHINYPLFSSRFFIIILFLLPHFLVSSQFDHIFIPVFSFCCCCVAVCLYWAMFFCSQLPPPFKCSLHSTCVFMCYFHRQCNGINSLCYEISKEPYQVVVPFSHSSIPFDDVFFVVLHSILIK